MDLVPWQPFRELERMRHTFDRFFADPIFQTGTNFGMPAIPFPVEVFEQDAEVVVRCEMAGVDPKDVDVRVTDEGVTFRGERKAERQGQESGAFRSERFYGTFSRSLAFPVPVESAQATATFKNGLLEVRAPKRNPETGRDGRRLNIDTLH